MDEDDGEIIAGYRVHPAAAVFPLIEGDDFDNLVESIIFNGMQHGIVVRRTKDGDLLIDGRNRLRAAEKARQQGHTVDVPIVEWVEDGRNVAQWIWDTNAIRRQMGEEGFVMASAAISPMIAEENRQRQQASQFKKGSEPGPGRGKTVDTKTSPPFKRDIKAKHEASTVGQVAAKAGTTKHKARQAIAVQRAIESGELPADTAKAVMAGKKKLKDVAPKATRKPREKKHRAMKPMLDDLRDLIAEWKNADHNVETLRDELKTHIERM